MPNDKAKAEGGEDVEESGGPYEAVTIWEAPSGSQWRLTFALKRVEGRPECVGLEVVSLPDFEHPERPLNAKTMRALQFSGELDRARRGQAARDDRLIDLGRRLGGSVSGLAEERAVMAPGEGKARKRYTTKDLQRVAAEYSRAWSAEPPSKSPTRDTSELLGLRYDQTAKLIQRCRKLGLLPSTDKGVARGATEEDG